MVPTGPGQTPADDGGGTDGSDPRFLRRCAHIGCRGSGPTSWPASRWRPSRSRRRWATRRSPRRRWSPASTRSSSRPWSSPCWAPRGCWWSAPTRRPPRSSRPGLAALGIAGLTPELAEWLALTQPRRRSSAAACCSSPGCCGSASSATSCPRRCSSASSPASASRCSPARSPTCSGSPRARATGSSSSGTTMTHLGGNEPADPGVRGRHRWRIILGFKRFAPAVPGAIVAVVLLDHRVGALHDAQRTAWRWSGPSGRLPADRAAAGHHLVRRPQGAAGSPSPASC